MPFYHGLSVRESDTDEERADKRRVAGRLLALRKALAEHISQSDHGDIGDDGRDEYEQDEHHEEHAHSDDSSRLLRLATWNIRELDSNKYGRRLRESLYYIAEIISTFDLVAVQEVREDISALRSVMRILGPTWAFIATDVTEGTPGNRERMVFVYNRAKVRFRNIAGELVLPASERVTHRHEERLAVAKALTLQLPRGSALESPTDVKTYKRSGKHYLSAEVPIDLPEGVQVELPEGSQVVLPKGYEVTVAGDGIELPRGTSVSLPEKGKKKRVMVKLPKGAITGDSVQFARTPALVAFQSGWLKINLCTVHIYYGSDKAGLERRKEEIRRLTKFLAKRAANDRDSDSDSFFVALGDFNIVDKSHETMQALTTNGFVVPDALAQIPEGSNVDRSKYYDQIAYWAGSEGRGVAKGVTTFEVHRAGVFDFFKTVFRMGDDDPGNEDQTHYRRVYRQFPGYKASWKYKDWRTFQVSDHLPMWIELRIDFGDEYLEQICYAE